jgi:hypothetical protein
VSAQCLRHQLGYVTNLRIPADQRQASSIMPSRMVLWPTLLTVLSSLLSSLLSSSSLDSSESCSACLLARKRLNFRSASFASAASASFLRMASRATALLLRHCSSRFCNQSNCRKVSTGPLRIASDQRTPCSPHSLPSFWMNFQMLLSSSAVRAMVSGVLSISNLSPMRGNLPPGRGSHWIDSGALGARPARGVGTGGVGSTASARREG